MTRAALIAIAVGVLGCNRLDQARAKSTAQKLETKHLVEVRRVADDLEKSCVRPAGVSPVSGTSLDSNPAVVEVEVSCRQSNGDMAHATRLRGTSVRLDDGFFHLGIGKNADAGIGAGVEVEESVNVPSTIIANANDLCVLRPDVKICVAYRD